MRARLAAADETGKRLRQGPGEEWEWAAEGQCDHPFHCSGYRNGGRCGWGLRATTTKVGDSAVEVVWGTGQAVVCSGAMRGDQWRSAHGSDPANRSEHGRRDTVRSETRLTQKERAKSLGVKNRLIDGGSHIRSKGPGVVKSKPGKLRRPSSRVRSCSLHTKLGQASPTKPLLVWDLLLERLKTDWHCRKTRSEDILRAVRSAAPRPPAGGVLSSRCGEAVPLSDGDHASRLRPSR